MLKRYFIPISIFAALILALFGQGFVLLLLPNAYTQGYKMFQSGVIQFLSIVILAILISSGGKSGGRGNFRVPHLRF